MNVLTEEIVDQLQMIEISDFTDLKQTTVYSSACSFCSFFCDNNCSGSCDTICPGSCDASCVGDCMMTE